MTANIEDFKRQADCVYKNEHYSVRDNGAVFRHSRHNRLLRKHDNHWTFGTPNNNGYLLIASEVVHRIVAYAFLGEPPSQQHIIDHIDTNRQNNRPENLRWLTKLENILNNPITLKKIIFYCGSIDAFLEDPSILKNYVSEDRNFGWMRTVTPEEAQISWKHLSSWSTNKKTLPKSGELGEWIFKDNIDYSSFEEISEFTNSLTSNAVQKDWKTPCEFPFCPKESNAKPITTYTSNLKLGEYLSRNRYSNSIIVDYELSKDESTLWVMCKSSDNNAIKPWSLAQITYENGLFVHENLGSFFEKEGADKQFALVQGLEWTGGDTFDDQT
jgi:hypothetical protein